MKISIITLTFPPEPAQHILDLAAGLVTRGHNVTVLTSLPSYPYGRVYDAYRGRFMSIEHVQNVKVVRLPVFPSHARSFLKRGLYYLTNAFSIMAYNLLTLSSSSDVTIVYHPPLSTALPALLMKKIMGKKFVHWIHDMWPETLEEGGYTNKKVLCIIDGMAKYVYKRSAHIMVLSEGFKRNLIAKGVSHEKITAIPNWANPEKYPQTAKKDADYSRNGLMSGNYHVLYAGNLGEMQALESVIAAMKLLADEKDVVLLFLGSGTREQKLRQCAIELGVADRVKFLGRVSLDQVNAYYAMADVLIVHLKDTKLFQITIPHKIYEYMLAAKPIIIAVKGDARQEVVSAEAGIACEPEDPGSIADAIRRTKALSPQERLIMGENGRKFILDNRSPGVMIDRIESILLGVVNEQEHSSAQDATDLNG